MKLCEVFTLLCIFQLRKRCASLFHPCFLPWVSNQNPLYSWCNGKYFGETIYFLILFIRAPPLKDSGITCGALSPDKKAHYSISPILPLDQSQAHGLFLPLNNFLPLYLNNFLPLNNFFPLYLRLLDRFSRWIQTGLTFRMNTTQAINLWPQDTEIIILIMWMRQLREIEKLTAVTCQINGKAKLSEARSTWPPKPMLSPSTICVMSNVQLSHAVRL